jgi:O-antigen/teichoic acid export membrane protein
MSSVFKNIFALIIGKNYSAKVLGYYTNADQYSGIPSNTIASVTNKVSYPILTTFQDDNFKLKASTSKLLKTLMYVSFSCMFGLATIAKPLFLFLFGEKWLPAVSFFQILCIAYSITPLICINQNIMKVKGRSDMFLRTEIIKYIVIIPIIALGIRYGLKVLIVGIAFFYWISFFINAMYSHKLIKYSITNQFIDLIPVLLLNLPPALLVWSMSLWIHLPNLLILILQSVLYFILVIGLSIIFKNPAFIEIKQLILRKLSYIKF